MLCDVCGSGSKFTQAKILGKKPPPLLLCHDLTLRSCVPSDKDSTRAVLNPSASFYVSLQEQFLRVFAFFGSVGSVLTQFMLRLHLRAQERC